MSTVDTSGPWRGPDGTPAPASMWVPEIGPTEMLLLRALLAELACPDCASVVTARYPGNEPEPAGPLDETLDVNVQHGTGCRHVTGSAGP